MLIGLGKKNILNRLDKIVAFAELEQFIDDPLKTYSTGMQARLAFSVALELNPDVLLIDEVLGVGDVSFQEKAVSTMKAKIASDLTVVFVSHDLATARELCSRILWLEGGKTKMEGNSDEVIDAYLKYHQSQ